MLPLALMCLLLCMGAAGWSAQGAAETTKRAIKKHPAQANRPAPPPQFIVTRNDAGFTLPEIVLQYDAATKTGFNWAELEKLSFGSQSPSMAVAIAVRYLREAVQRMTGKELPVVSRNDLGRGIVLTTLDGAPSDLKKDPEVIKAVSNTGKDAYNANEAFFIRTEPQRVVIIANTVDGLSNGVVELLESAGYEVLGMGPNWMHVPDFTTKPLSFALKRAGRPGFYIRQLAAASGQPGGIGTLFLKPLPDPTDETVEVSYYYRWLPGTRMMTQSMPYFPGHAMQAYHKAVIEKMKESKSTAGFLLDKVDIGPDAQRPPAPGSASRLWINDDAAGQPGAGKIYLSDGTKWYEGSSAYVAANLDLSVPMVREIVLQDMKQKAQAHFDNAPDDIFVFGTDPEDGGGYARLAEHLHDKNWYPEYLAKEGVGFGQPYVLNGFKGLDQPREIWDPAAPADNVFGFNNWLLREFDKWIDALPAEQRLTKTGKSKKEMVRASLYSYNYHDVPANFNLDPRMRVMIADYPKHRGQGKWKDIASHLEIAQAFQKQLPREPSGDYWILSLAAFYDTTTAAIGNSSKLPATLHRQIQEEYKAGFRAISAEIDFNFGRLGLDYYLYPKLLWNPQMTVAELEALRERWIQRAYGSAWREMKQYYDFMAPENFVVNAPNNWAKAIRMIDAADKKLDGAKEPEAQRRLDDQKQFWYFYYLLESGQAKPDSKSLHEFLWKGQMSYMTAMHAIATNIFKNTDVRAAVGPEFNNGPAHYTHAETQEWWAKILDFWKVTPVSDFGAATLADGIKGKAVDQKDLVMVKEFQTEKPSDAPYTYPADYQKATVLTVASKAGQEIGFKLSWPFAPAEARYSAKDVAYGIARWNPQTKSWEDLVDITMTKKPSVLVEGKDNAKAQVVEARYDAPKAGTYRIDVGLGGNFAKLTSLDYDVATDTYTGTRPFTYLTTLEGYTQSPAYIYIPKGTKSLDLEVWNATNIKKLQLHTGLPATSLKPTRLVDVGTQGTHRVTLNPGEDGSIAYMYGDVFNFPHLYSIPMLWAKSPGALLVPRAVAKADGLTVIRGG